MYLWIGRNCHPNFLTQVLGVPNYAAVPENLVGNVMVQFSPSTQMYFCAQMYLRTTYMSHIPLCNILFCSYIFLLVGPYYILQDGRFLSHCRTTV